MTLLCRTFWVLVASGTVFAAAAWIAGCVVDGVTPNCSVDGGDCFTPPGHALPTSDDAGTN